MQDINKDKRQAGKGAIRLFFIDEKTGNPVTGMVVNIFADSPGNRSQLLATLQTDQAGYASFKFDRSTIAASSQLRIMHGVSHGNALALNVADLLAGNDTHTIRFDASALDISALSPGLPAIIAPDVKDLTLSPGSIGHTPHLLPGRGLCSQLMPTTMGVRRFEAFHILADICRLETFSCPERIQIVRGTMLEYEVVWHPSGTSLGDLLNTITLAPCEQVNVAIVDWMRREVTSLTQASDVRQQATQQMDHDRLISEAMQSTVKNKSLMGASGTTSGATATVPLEGVMLNMTGALGASVAGSISKQTLAANTTNELSERITQASSFVSSQRNSAVYQTTASEHQTYQTRTVRNHNHCHTLTMMYYQVNRNYRVVTEYKGEREVILVKYENDDFDAKRAYCNAHLLKDALLDPNLRSCFDELGDALFCCDQTPVGKEGLMDSLTITMNVAAGGGIITAIQVTLNTANGQVALPLTNTGWAVPGTHTQTINLPVQVDPKQVNAIFISFHSLGGLSGSGFGGGSTNLFIASDIDVTYHAVGYPNPLKLASLHTPTEIRQLLVMEAKAEIPPTKEGRNPCVEASCCIQKLLGHLNCHKRYYNRIVWLNEDQNERVMRWSCCRDGDEQFSFIDQIENNPLAVYGDFVVFPVAGSQPIDDPAVVPVSKLVTMPTPGVYAEGILGQCDTCEKIDSDRFWDWKDSPCPDNAPTVSSPSDPQTSVKPSDLRADAISNFVTFSSVPGAPESGIKDLISTLLAHADKGSAEAKAMLDKLMDTIKASIPPATALPGQPKKE